MKNARKSGKSTVAQLLNAMKAVTAAATGAGIVGWTALKSAGQKAAEVKTKLTTKEQNTKEGITMKKSTFVALIVALSAVAGVLAALYFYVIRREKELDEYEQLLFSGDFGDEMSYDDDQDVMVEAPIVDEA